MKRFTKVMVALLLVAAMIVTLCPAVSAANYRNFVDVPWSYEVQYQDAINYAADNGLMLGYDSGYFMPDQFVTRQEFIVVMFRASGDTGTYNEAAVFTDVSASSPFYNAIGWAINKGITAGTSATTFSPENLVTREQAMLFLYRFAGVLGHDRTADEDITQAADYARVEPYAHTAISWAYEYGILTRSANTASINPKETLLRKHSALYINRFRRNVEGIVFGRDNYSFNNNALGFFSKYAPEYLITADDWNLFGEYMLNEWSDRDNPLDYDSIGDYTDIAWEGSCYGMAITTILDYLGKIDVNGDYCNDVDTLAEIPSLISFGNPHHNWVYDHDHPTFEFALLESKINYYQFTQHIPRIAQWSAFEIFSTELPDVLMKLEHGGIGIFSYFATYPSTDENGNPIEVSVNHAVVIYGKPIETEKGYKVRVYDNRNCERECWLEIEGFKNADGSLSSHVGYITYSNIRENVLWAKYEDDFSIYDTIGAEYHANTTYAMNSSVLEESTLLEIRATGDFTITNAEGETLAFSISDKTGVSGTMDVSSINFVPYGESAVFQFFVDPSDSFTCVADNGYEVFAFRARTNGDSGGESASTMTDGSEELTAVMEPFVAE